MSVIADYCCECTDKCRHISVWAIARLSGFPPVAVANQGSFDSDLGSIPVGALNAATGVGFIPVADVPATTNEKFRFLKLVARQEGMTFLGDVIWQESETEIDRKTGRVISNRITVSGVPGHGGPDWPGGLIHYQRLEHGTYGAVITSPNNDDGEGRGLGDYFGQIYFPAPGTDWMASPHILVNNTESTAFRRYESTIGPPDYYFEVANTYTDRNDVDDCIARAMELLDQFQLGVDERVWHGAESDLPTAGAPVSLDWGGRDGVDGKGVYWAYADLIFGGGIWNLRHTLTDDIEASLFPANPPGLPGWGFTATPFAPSIGPMAIKTVVDSDGEKRAVVAKTLMEVTGDVCVVNYEGRLWIEDPFSESTLTDTEPASCDTVPTPETILIEPGDVEAEAGIVQLFSHCYAEAAGEGPWGPTCCGI